MVFQGPPIQKIDETPVVFESLFPRLFVICKDTGYENKETKRGTKVLEKYQQTEVIQKRNDKTDTGKTRSGKS